MGDTMNKKTMAMVAAAFILTAAAVPVDAGELDESQTTVDTAYEIMAGDPVGAAQSFKVDQTWLHKIRFYFDPLATNTIDVIVDTDTNADNGCIVRKNSWDVSGWDAGWHTWDIQAEHGAKQLTPGNTYYLIVLPYIFSSSAEWYGTGGDPYSRGMAYYMTSSGGIQEIGYGYVDFGFEVYTERETEPNDPPTVGSPSPADGATGISTDAVLEVNVSDPNGDTVTVIFYNGVDGTTIGMDTVEGGSGTAGVTWTNLDNAKEHAWYVTADDGRTTTTSPTWTFTTAGTGGNAIPVISNPSPADGATGVNTTVNLSVDVTDGDGDRVTVSFHDAGTGSLLGTDNVTNGTASIARTGLATGTNFSWFTIADDGTDSIQSDTWRFQTTGTPPVPPTDEEDLMLGALLLGCGGVIGAVLVWRDRKAKRANG